MSLGSDVGFQDLYYCGRPGVMDRDLPNNGQCGPNNGPQCASCTALQSSDPPAPPTAQPPSIPFQQLHVGDAVRLRVARHGERVGSVKKVEEPSNAALFSREELARKTIVHVDFGLAGSSRWVGQQAELDLVNKWRPGDPHSFIGRGQCRICTKCDRFCFDKMFDRMF